METELAGQASELNVRFLGVNELGRESGNDNMPTISDIPWLQDVDSNADGVSDLWSAWGIAYRDIAILNANNEIISTFNVTTNDLSVPADYEELKSRIVAAANPGSGGETTSGGTRWPGGWAFLQWPYLYDLDAGGWLYFDEGGETWQANLSTGQWDALSAVGGWVYFLDEAGYFYDAGASQWRYISPDTEQWVNQLDTGEWFIFRKE